MLLRDLFLGFVKLHILYHAGQHPVYGLWLIDELAHHGYALSSGTLYPALKSLERAGYLASYSQVVDGKVRKYYTLTDAGRDALQDARAKAVALVQEIAQDSSEKR
jgi:PadR family transcriptional regulator PadR